MTTWHDIPGWFDFEDIYSEAVAKAPVNGARFVELGTFFGRSTLYMAEAIRASGKKIEFFAIDFLGYRPPKERRDGHTDEIWELIVKHGCVRGVFDHFVGATELGPYVKPLIGDAAESAIWFADDSIDFVFNDASHDYGPLLASLKKWLPRVKPGGVIGGHDYRNHDFPGVARAVDEVLPERMIRGTSFYYRKPV